HCDPNVRPPITMTDRPKTLVYPGRQALACSQRHQRPPSHVTPSTALTQWTSPGPPAGGRYLRAILAAAWSAFSAATTAITEPPNPPPISRAPAQPAVSATS